MSNGVIEINEEVKINLTISTHYVKGNNSIAQEIQKARVDEKFSKEPNIKDVISGDYSRK